MSPTLTAPVSYHQQATEPVSLIENEVHLWTWTWSTSGLQDSTQALFLSPTEIATMEQFHLPEDRMRYARCHHNLRLLLGRYLGLNPRELRFETNLYGKPHLCPSHGDNHLHFSLSHTRTAALLAIAREMPVGVDIEQCKSIPPHGPETYFSPRERKELEQLQGEQRTRGFYNAWTRKEAILKAEGFGLSCPLASFSVTLTPGAEARLIEKGPDSSLTTDWKLLDLKLGPDFIASLATPIVPHAVGYFQLAP